MANNSGNGRREDQMDLPPGFRFHPTDEELITHYLWMKVLDPSFSPTAIAEVDMNKVEPWELPGRAKMGEKEWYFFCVRDRKYPTGSRTNRATPAGYWKATGKDREIYRGKTLVGMKKTLVFYQGRAPKGEKSNWVCHEYRMDENSSIKNPPEQAQNDWVITRLFQKPAGGDRVGIAEVESGDSGEQEVIHPAGPQLTDPPVPGETQPEEMEAGQGASFSAAMADDAEKILGDSMACFENSLLSSHLNNSFSFDSFSMEQLGLIQAVMGLDYPGWIPPPQDPLSFRGLAGNVEQNLTQGFGTGIEMGSASQGPGTYPGWTDIEMGNGFDFGDQQGPSGAFEPQDLDDIWYY